MVGLINFLATVPEIDDNMYEWIQSVLNDDNSMATPRLNDFWKSNGHQSEYFKNYELLRRRSNDNSHLPNKSINNKKANTILSKLLLIVFLKLNAKTEQMAQILLETIFDMLLNDFVQLDPDDDHFIQVFQNVIYYKSNTENNIVSSVLRYVFHCIYFFFFTFMLSEFIHMKSIHFFSQKSC